ncbi:PAS/PAC sensor protein [Oceanococcus atlanticus]|uniref:PAS/PAC sensor protein n=1 Tax=Oceanococcus atlanticus TaxID=1317117 RepID=A0A1Y1SEY6_9GAMM|nr:CDC27 family protein [Oceanococcus atlanticus]ORE88212.1 PAS/PAC sensor protein [Oceanococcus atlanticus]
MAKIFSKLLVSVMLAALLGSPVLAKDDDAGRKPPTRVTEKLSPKVYQKIEAAQQALEAKDLAGAAAIMDELNATADKLNDYEKSQMYNFYAAIHYEQGDIAATIADYIAILKLDNPPEQIRTNSLFRLAQLYFVQEDYSKAIRVLQEWQKNVDSVRPEAHMLLAQAYYQLEDYDAAKAPVIEAMKEARRRGQPLQENWLALLRAVYYELGDYKSAVKVLAQLIQRWPNPSYYKQLSGMLGLMGQQKGQLYVMHAAYTAGMLEGESELLNMARLYMAEDAPYPAIEIIKQGLDDGTIEDNAQNLQLLAQAMALAKDSEGQIPVLQRAAELSGEARQYLYLGQAQISQYLWADAASSLQKALDIGGLDRPGSVYMQLGTAQFNLKRYSRALQAFKEAAAYEDYAQQARQWVAFVNQEIQRERAIRNL